MLNLQINTTACDGSDVFWPWLLWLLGAFLLGLLLGWLLKQFFGGDGDKVAAAPLAALRFPREHRMRDGGEGEVAEVVDEVFHALLHGGKGQGFAAVAGEVGRQQRPLVLPTQASGF